MLLSEQVCFTLEDVPYMHGAWSETPIRDTSCGDQPLTAAHVCVSAHAGVGPEKILARYPLGPR